MSEALLAASGPIARPFRKMSVLLSQCPTFQSLMGVGTAAAALELIDSPFWDAEDHDTSSDAFQTIPVPGATVTRTDGQSCDIRNSGHSIGELSIEFRAKPSGDYTLKSNQLMEFMNSVGAILQEIFQRERKPNPDGGTHLQIHEPIQEAITPQFTRQDVEADENGKPFLVAMYSIQYEE
jgi:hypothetical protein